VRGPRELGLPVRFGAGDEVADSVAGERGVQL